MSKRTFFIGLILAVLTAAIIAPLVYLSSSSGSARTVKVATSQNAWCALTLVALDTGLFEKHGLVPEATYNAAGRINMDALLSGSADAANIVEMNIANAARAGERDLLILGTINRAWDYAVVAHGRNGAFDRPDVEARIESLRGRRIGYAPGTGAEPFLYALLQKYRIREDEVTLVRIPPTGLVDQFVARSVDVAISWEPFVDTMSKRMNGNVTIHRDPSVFQGIMTLAVRRPWANENRDTVVRLERVYRDASRFIAQDKERAQAIVARHMGLPLEQVSEIWERFAPEFRHDDQVAQASVQAAIDVISRSSTPSQTDINYKSYFRR